MRIITRGAAAIALSLVAACAGGDNDPRAIDVVPRLTSTTQHTDDRPPQPTSTTQHTDDRPPQPTTSATSGSGTSSEVTVEVRALEPIGAISPLIRGVSGGVDEQYLRDIGATLNSWGGNPATRYNYEIGHAWNAGADWEFRNGNYGLVGDVALDFGRTSSAGGTVVRLAVPTLGWIASDDLGDTCSFPTGTSGCDGAAGHDCANPGPIADPTTANVESDPASVARWVADLIAAGLPIEFIAMDNEPELWGNTHYDVHPECTTYEEVLETYTAYSTVISEVAPDVKLLGPVACCWFDYWNIAPGTTDGRDVDYIAWFLEQIRLHDEARSSRSLDVLDVHFYPQSGVYNDDVDDETAARRLRSTRSLWDRGYQDESWISTAIAFIPRMQETIEATYPGTGLAISEWNFGADTDINGALAIADVLGIYGREGVELASYWQHPPERSPGYFAFKLHGNYDDAGSSFGGEAVPAETSDIDRLGAFAAIDRDAGLLRLMLLNKQPELSLTVPVSLDGVNTNGVGRSFRYSATSPDEIVADEATLTGSSSTVVLPASSITVLEFGLDS